MLAEAAAMRVDRAAAEDKLLLRRCPVGVQVVYFHKVAPAERLVLQQVDFILVEQVDIIMKVVTRVPREHLEKEETECLGAILL